MGVSGGSGGSGRAPQNSPSVARSIRRRTAAKPGGEPEEGGAANEQPPFRRKTHIGNIYIGEVFSLRVNKSLTSEND